MVPAEQSRAVAAACHARTVEVDGADHNDGVLLDGDQLVNAVVGAFRSLARIPGTPGIGDSSPRRRPCATVEDVRAKEREDDE
jgi:hypothetical protein